MTIASTINRNDYTGDGTTNEYDYTFKILSEEDLKVIVRDSDDVETILELDTDYTVADVGEVEGGSITLVDADQEWLDGDGFLDEDWVLTIRRVRQLKQETDIRNQGDYFPEVIEDEFDRQMMIAQQQQDEINRSIRLPDTISAAEFDATLPTTITTPSSLALVTKADGSGFELGPTTTAIGDAQQNAVDAAASADLAEEWATKVNDHVTGSTETSAKAYAIGGTGDGYPDGGSAKDWAIKTSDQVASTDFSAKEYARGSQASTGGSAKNWAQQTGADVTGADAGSKSAKSWAAETGANAPSDGSAKEWATETSAAVASSEYSAKAYAQSEGLISSGSAKEWATKTGSAVAGGEFSAKHHAQAAATSAAAAATTLASALWRDVQFLTDADSPKTIDSDDNGVLFVCDTTSGAITINLPEISVVGIPFNVGFKFDSGANPVTINPDGTDTIGGSATKILNTTGSGTQLIADNDPAPDDWTDVDFGAVGGNLTIDRFSGDNSETDFELSVQPSSENNTWVYIEGVYQQKDTYSVSGTTLTFSSAPPTGTDNIEVIIGASLSINVPADGTVTNLKLANSAVAGHDAITSIDADDTLLVGDTSASELKKITHANLSKSRITTQTGTYTATEHVDVILANPSASFTITLPSAASNPGKEYRIHKIDADVSKIVTIARSGSDTIGYGAVTSTTLNTQGEEVVLVSDGTSNWILKRIIPSVWASYTPTFTGFGTVSTHSMWWKRSGDVLWLKGRFISGTSTATEARISFPNSVVSDPAKLNANIELGGLISVNAAGATTFGWASLIEPSVAYYTIGRQTSTGNYQTKINGSAFLSSGEIAVIQPFSVPITGWNG